MSDFPGFTVGMSNLSVEPAINPTIGGAYLWHNGQYVTYISEREATNLMEVLSSFINQARDNALRMFSDSD